MVSSTSERTNLRCRPSLMLGRTPRRAYSSTVERGMCNSSATWSAVRRSSIPLMPGRHVLACEPQRACTQSSDDAPTGADASPHLAGPNDADLPGDGPRRRCPRPAAGAGIRSRLGIEGASHVLIDVRLVNRTPVVRHRDAPWDASPFATAVGPGSNATSLASERPGRDTSRLEIAHELCEPSRGSGRGRVVRHAVRPKGALPVTSSSCGTGR